MCLFVSILALVFVRALHACNEKFKNSINIAYVGLYSFYTT